MLKMKNQLNFGMAVWIFSILVQVSSASGFPKSCSEIQPESGSNSSRLQNYVIYPDGPDGASLEVLCDFETEVDGGGWTVIQKRTSGPREEFAQNWTAYKNGFGSLDKNFWIGLDNIHALTKSGDQELRIELQDFDGYKAYAKYNNFSISDPSDFYRLSISGFSRNSTAGDAMGDLDESRFSTVDKDNDGASWTDCSVRRGNGGWWFSDCGYANLNGGYYEKGESVPFEGGIYWDTWHGGAYPMEKSEIKIRTRK